MATAAPAMASPRPAESLRRALECDPIIMGTFGGLSLSACCPQVIKRAHSLYWGKEYAFLPAQHLLPLFHLLVGNSY